MDWVSYTPSSRGLGVDDKHSLYLGVFLYDTAGKSCSPKATGSFELEYRQELSSLDLAFYRLSASTIAFGVRTKTYFMYGGGGGMNQDISLYIVDDSSVVQVMSTPLASSSMTAGQWNDDGTRDHSDNGDDAEATFAMLKSSSNGYFDILKSRDTKKAIYKWNGSTYETAGADPVENVNAN